MQLGAALPHTGNHLVDGRCCRYEHLVRLYPENEEYKLYFSQSLYKVRTAQTDMRMWMWSDACSTGSDLSGREHLAAGCLRSVARHGTTSAC
jgi:hypothetical protein